MTPRETTHRKHTLLLAAALLVGLGVVVGFLAKHGSVDELTAHNAPLIADTTGAITPSGLEASPSTPVNSNEEPLTPNQALQLTQRHAYELVSINDLLHREHYLKFDLDDEFSRRILNSYLDELDLGRLFFVAQDVNEFRQLQDNFDDYIRRGQLTPASTIFDIYLARVRERVEYARARLQEPFDFTIDEYYDIDREDTPWAADSAALNEAWRKRVKNDFIDQLLGGKSEEEARAMLLKRYDGILRRAEQINADELFQLIANAYAKAIEPHTSYFSPRASEEFNIHMRLSLEGIGAVLRLDGEHTRVVSVVPGGPADLSRMLDPGDRIIGVAQGRDGEIIDIVGWRLSDVVDIIRGKKDTIVSLSILPNETGVSGEPQYISITRDKIRLEDQAAKSRIINTQTEQGQSRIGVLELPTFYSDFEARRRGERNYRSVTRDVARLLGALNQEEIDGLIIDLRGNGGGALEEVVALTGLFIDKGPVVQVHHSSNRVQIRRDPNQGTLYNGPLMVMVDRQSASASEIFAGAIQDYKRGIIIGDSTFGKGTVQSVLEIPPFTGGDKPQTAGGLKITIAQFFRVNGDSTQHRGVIPDISWPLPDSDDDIGERAYKNALPWRQINRAEHAPYPQSVQADILEKARAQHLKRSRNDLAYLSTLMKLRLLAEARDKKHISLNLDMRKTERQHFNEQLLEAENAIRGARNEPLYEDVAAMQADNDQDEFTRPADNKKDNEPDVFLKEASNILNDYRLMSQDSQTNYAKVNH